LQELVESAVGFNAERGDVITLKSMDLPAIPPFGTEATSSFFQQLQLDIMSIVQMSVLALVTLVLGLFVVRPILANGAVAALPAPAALPGPGGESDIGLASGDMALGTVHVGEIDDGPGNTFSALPEMNMADPSQFGGGLPALGGASDDPVDRLRAMIGERQEETVEILRSWLEESEEET
jgi:flagellar M-ring protein FliF